MSSSAMSSTMPRMSRTVNWGRFAPVACATMIAAVLANIVVYFIGGALVTYDPRFDILVNVAGVAEFSVRFSSPST